MSPSPGTRLGHYEIVETIGKGGMGEVYRARDTRLPRDTAIKVSAEKFSERFAREAHAIASLNHPNITTLYDVGPDYLVMELVEGPTLADRIRQGVLTLDEASAIARQIADALEYAHEKGVIHRDLKPGNVKIRPDGVVKVLDFGLAKSGMSQSASRSDESPTISAHQTEAGVVLGTAAYMAPEQAKGKEVDKRADIWAFGCVFYEMLTGTPPHQGDSSQETLASILRDAPDLDKIPVQARRLLKRCLEKDPQKRLRHIGDVMALLDEPPSGPMARTAAPSVTPANTESNRKWLWPAVATAGVVIVGLGLMVWSPWQTQTTAVQAIRFPVAETAAMKFFYGGAMAVSPNGRWMVFPAIGEDGVFRYWVRSLETVEARALPGTEGAFTPAAWSADSRYVIFSVIGLQQLKRIDIQGGPPQTLTDMRGGLNGAAANRDGTVLFGSSLFNQPIFRVSPGGGTPAPVTLLADRETGHKYPQFLPDGRHFLYMRLSSDPKRMGVYVGDVDAKPEDQSREPVLVSNRQAYYAAPLGAGPGHLISLRGTTLMAQPFDPVRMMLSGDPVPVAEGVDSFPAQSYGLFSVSDNGALVYRESGGQALALTWFNQNGSLTATLGEPGDYANPAVSPDQTRIAVALSGPGGRDLWIVDIARAGATTRFTFDPGNDDFPVWSPDSTDIVFSSNRSGRQQIYIKRADGSGEERLLSDRTGTPTSWSKDGRFLLFTSITPKTGADIWALPDPRRTSADTKPFPILETSFDEAGAQFSPDGRWIAYTSNESSVSDIYVRPFSADGTTKTGGAKYLVSRVSGLSYFPRWQPDGTRLFYAAAATWDIRAVDIDTSKGFRAGTPRRLFAAPPPLIPGWNISPDGQRFLFVTTPDGGKPTPFTVVLNWAAALQK